jgi:hypothetical protein
MVFLLFQSWPLSYLLHAYFIFLYVGNGAWVSIKSFWNITSTTYKKPDLRYCSMSSDQNLWVLSWCFLSSINWYKAHIVVLSNKQEYGLDYDETFAPVTKMSTVQTILALATSQSWYLQYMDVKNTFLHSDLMEEVYMKLLSNMPTSLPNDVCKLKWSLYGLK